MASFQPQHTGRQMTGAVTCFVAVTIVACSGERFSNAVDGANSNISPQNNGDGGPSSGSVSPTEDTACGLARVDSTAKAVDVCIPQGQFVMGSAAANLGGTFSDHSPPHTVTLSAYFIDAYEVTVGRFRACVQAGACDPPAATATGCTFSAQPGSADLLPVNCILYASASAFCKWDGGRRLPTEAEWERVARGTAASNYPWGDTFSCEHAVVAATTSCSAYDPKLPAQVGKLQAGVSAEGVYDLVGNVAEWVSDWVGSYPRTDVTDPTGPTTGTQHVVRGGDWLSPTTQAMAYLRRSSMPTNSGTLGFRCVRDPG
jgi:sulfatase modifying factor 1